VNAQTQHKAVFLDRDGTINVEKNYLYKIEDFVWLDGAIEAIRLLNEHGFKTVVVTNQAGIARGFYSPNDVHILHDYIQRELRKHKAEIDAFFYCPHHPEGVVEEFRRSCDCRKPNTGMIVQARERLNIDLNRSYLIGDHWSDVGLGQNANIRTIVVKTGYGMNAADRIREEKIHVECITENLLEAVRYILKAPNSR
jgi:D-glycero-D-manno-heptose 1,7-bisphosphate phosphatase